MRTRQRLIRFVAALTVLRIGLTGSAIAADFGPYNLKLDQVDAHAFHRVTLFGPASAACVRCGRPLRPGAKFCNNRGQRNLQ